MGIYASSKPYTRWWWFSGKIREEDIRYQLDWLKQHNFGGVEIAWVYALRDSGSGPRWLSEEWSKLVTYTKRYALKIGLGCDFTFSTLWPFGGSFVRECDASKTFRGLSTQRLWKSWEEPHVSSAGYIINHLDHKALEHYAQKMGAAVKLALQIGPSALFCDSWEVCTDMLWTEGFDKKFSGKYNYDINVYMPNIDKYPDIRYDYRRLLAEYVLKEFYIPFTNICHDLGGFSRVQCHGAPTDLLAAYSAVDIPESEASLFDPHFSQFAASAAALSGKRIVSAESFTCLYGWKPWPGPGPYQKQEQVADMKLLVDGLFANGINFIIWHGMPYNPQGVHNQFYASVHVGPDSPRASEFVAFNNYIEHVSEFMRRGITYCDLAVYLPLEDNWMRNELPKEKQRPSAKYFWELQYQKFAHEVYGYRPVWISDYFLERAEYHDGQLHYGDANFTSLYVDVEWLDREALSHILRLAQQGLPIFMKRKPVQPGFIKNESYEKDLRRLFNIKNVKTTLQKQIARLLLVEGGDIPEFWCRVDGDDAFIFFAHPKTKEITYPMRYGYSYCTETRELTMAVNFSGKKIEFKLVFEPYQSILVRIDKAGNLDFEDIYFKPEIPQYK